MPGNFAYDVTVVTPVFNGERFIAQSIASVLDQKRVSLEFLVVDDGSTDSSYKLALSMTRSHDFSSVIRQDNKGEAGAVNEGLRRAKGEFALILNADDLLAPEALARLFALLREHEDAVAAYPDWNVVNAEGVVVSTRQTLEFSRDMMFGEMHCLPGPGCLFRRVEHGKFLLRDERFKYVSDFDYWLRLGVYGNMTRVPDVLASWRQHPGGATARSHGNEYGQELIQLSLRFFARKNVPYDIAKYGRSSLALAHYYAALQKFRDHSVPGRRLMWRYLFLATGIRNGYRPKIRMRLLGVFAVMLIPLSKPVVSILRGSKKDV